MGKDHSIFNKPLNGIRPHSYDWWVEYFRLFPPSPYKPDPSTFRLFTDKELKTFAKRWRIQMDRAAAGKRRKTDTIPDDEVEVRRLVACLFWPIDAEILASEIFPPKKPQITGFFL